MTYVWAILALVVWLASASCIIGTIVEIVLGKTNLREGGFWGGVVFHGATALLALWLLLKALGKA